MASIVLGSVGTALGAATGLPFASLLGSALGRSIGGSIDGALFGGSLRPLNGPRLADLGVQSSTYGKMIPIVYGLMRIGGNIIWVQGKLGTSALAAILTDICTRSGLATTDIDVSRIAGQVDGFIINRQQTMPQTIESLQEAYFLAFIYLTYHQ